MNEQLQQKLKELPDAPGIYQMLDKKGNIIYIGKSKCLKKRVHSYFVPSPVWDKAKDMSHFIEDIEIIVTDTHLEAMLLECERIKRIKPYFNSMMKNDSKYSYLTLEENYRRNPLKITGGRENMSFGPFRSKGHIRQVIDSLRNLYPIIRKNGWYQLEYHVFPCSMEKEAFGENRKMLEQLFSGKGAMTRFLYAIEQNMKAAAAEQKFERASLYRDLYAQFSWLARSLSRFEEWSSTDLVYTVALKDGYKLFYISNGRIVYCEKAAQNTADLRNQFIEKAKYEKVNLPQDNEKALLDYRDIVCEELSGALDAVHKVE